MGTGVVILLATSFLLQKLELSTKSNEPVGLDFYHVGPQCLQRCSYTVYMSVTINSNIVIEYLQCGLYYYSLVLHLCIPLMAFSFNVLSFKSVQKTLKAYFTYLFTHVSKGHAKGCS